MYMYILKNTPLSNFQNSGSLISDSSSQKQASYEFISLFL